MKHFCVKFQRRNRYFRGNSDLLPKFLTYHLLPASDFSNIYSDKIDNMTTLWQLLRLNIMQSVNFDGDISGSASVCREWRCFNQNSQQPMLESCRLDNLSAKPTAKNFHLLQGAQPINHSTSTPPSRRHTMQLIKP